jgi:hypothetical protein
VPVTVAVLTILPTIPLYGPDIQYAIGSEVGEVTAGKAVVTASSLTRLHVHEIVFGGVGLRVESTSPNEVKSTSPMFSAINL